MIWQVRQVVSGYRIESSHGQPDRVHQEAYAMYSTELAEVIQQERERAIREARLHHRADLLPAGPRLQRLRAMVASLTAAFARRRVTIQDPMPTVIDRAGLPGTPCSSSRSGSGVTRG